MKIIILLAACLLGARALDPIEYPCLDPICQNEFLEGEECTISTFCDDCDPAVICPRLCASCNQHDGTYTLAGVSCDCPPLPPDCNPSCMFPSNGVWTCNAGGGCGGCADVPYPNAACDIMCAKCDEGDPKGGLVCECPDEPLRCDAPCLFAVNGKWTCRSQEGCKDCLDENPEACEIMCNKCQDDDPKGGLECDCGSAPPPPPPCNDYCLSDSLDSCSSTEGCEGCYDESPDACVIMCKKCDYGAPLGGLDCECPPPPPPCNDYCLSDSLDSCSSTEGCEGCEDEHPDACDIMCEKCDDGAPLGGLECTCAPDPTDPPGPDDKCFAACEAFPKGKWVCNSVEGCGGCDPATCDTLCDKCGGYGYQEFAGLGCDCGPAPTPNPGPGKCFAACGAYPKGKWVCDSIQGCDGCDGSICGTLCDKCGRPSGDNTIAGLECYCD